MSAPAIHKDAKTILLIKRHTSRKRKHTVDVHTGGTDHTKLIPSGDSKSPATIHIGVKSLHKSDNTDTIPIRL